MQQITHNYLKWAEQTINDFSSLAITQHYQNGFLFGRVGKGYMSQTRALRIDLKQFQPTSENRRILKKISGLTLEGVDLPIEQTNYDWQIHKLGKDFYDNKFGKGIFTAAKLKQLLTDKDNSNYNFLIKYTFEQDIVGYAICYKNEQLMHYAYPFYDLAKFPSNFGIGMMLTAIMEAKKWGLDYVYLGSFSSVKDLYKLQFNGLSWFDGQNWSTDLAKLKLQISPAN